MKRSNKIIRPALIWILLALLLLTAGCAAPQASNGLQQRLDELIRIQQQQAELLTQLQYKLTALQAQPHIATPGPAAGAEPEQADQPPEPVVLQRPKAPTDEETAEISAAAQIYLEAFAAIATGQMSIAEAGFKNFLQRFPDHEYSGNANYWMAEALFSQEKIGQAETVLLAIIDNENQQNKAPAAMARLISYYTESNAQPSATAMLQKLSSKYPDSPELKRLMRGTEPR